MKERPLSCMCLVFIVIQIVIFLMSGGHEVKVPADSIFLEEGEKEHISVRGTVYKKEHTSDYQVLYLKNNSIIYYDQTFFESQILVYDDEFYDVKIGNVIYAAGKAKSFESAHNPGNFDSRMYYAKKGLYGSLWSSNLQVLSHNVNEMAEALFQLKTVWSEQILKHMGERQGGLLVAMLMGEKSNLEQSYKELYQKTGMSHVLAISGLHISFLGVGLYHLLRKLGCPFSVSGILSGGILFLYVGMVGVPVSAFRAFFMLLLRIGADVFGREYDAVTAYLLSASIVLLYEPSYVLDAGFLLSYGAIAGILFLVPVISKLLPSWISRISGMQVSISVSIMLFPLLLYFYSEVSVYSILLNLLIIPLMSVILSLGVFGSLLCILWEGAGGVLLQMCKWILIFFEQVGDFVTRLPCSTMVLGKPSLFYIVFYYVILFLILVLLWSYKNKKVSRWYFSFLLLAWCLSVCTEHDTKGNVRITFLDVGQGDCAVIRGPDNRVYMIDGGSSDVSKVGKYRMIPYLKSQGITELDYVFVTHGDGDHYSGIMELLSEENTEIKVDTLVLPAVYEKQEALCNLKKMALQKEIRVASIHPGMYIEEGDLTITCIQPDEKMEDQEGNASSLVLDVTFGDVNVLFTGDVEEEGEVLLTKNLKGLDGYEVLKVAHHGSKNSSSKEILERVKPKVAIISAGRENSYGHPHTETLMRLKTWTNYIYSTARSGAITVESDGKDILVTGL